MDPMLWKSIIINSVAVGIVAIIGGVGVAIYKIYINKKTKPNNNNDDEEFKKTLTPANGIQTIENCKYKQNQINNEIKELHEKYNNAATKEDIGKIDIKLDNLAIKFDSMKDSIQLDIGATKMKTQTSMFKLKEELRKNGEIRMEKHEKKFKHEMR